MQSLGDVGLLNKTTREKIAVCERFGLSYWADHPLPGRMWAVDDQQQAHVIRWYKTAGYAVRQREVTKPAREKLWPYRLNTTAPTTFDTGERIAV